VKRNLILETVVNVMSVNGFKNRLDKFMGEIKFVVLPENCWV